MIAALAAAPGAARADGGKVVAGADAGLVKMLASQKDTDEIDVDAGLGYGVRIGYGLSDFLTFEFGFMRAQTEAQIGTEKRVAVTSDEAIFGVNWSVTNATWRPQILTGLTYHMARFDAPVEDENSFGLTAGLGLMGVIAPYLHAGLRGRYHYQFPEDLETVNLMTLMMAVDVWF
ncbi:MAG: outer membrane beta-barrel protein [Deltaproteobacteria bacterium]|nr:outer membrane beta-barrel protein [Deltaproteobacteria bacterium]